MSELLSIPVVSKDGVRGQVLTTSRLLDDSPEKLVIFENGTRASIAMQHLRLRSDGTYFLDLLVQTSETGLQLLEPSPLVAPVATPAQDVVIPVVQEQAYFAKRTVETGRVRITKTAVHESVTIEDETRRTEYEVVRVPVNRVVDSIKPTRVDGEVTIIPVYEEETVTATRLILREELHLIRKQTLKPEIRTVLLRKEIVEIEHLDPRSGAERKT